jgi:hypothetical protein
MVKYGKLAFASLRVFKHDLETYLNEVLEDFGLDKHRKNDDESFDELLEAKREKVIKKVNSFFDNLKNEISEDKSFRQSDENKALSDIALSIKELRHQLGQLQTDVNEMKSK